MDSHFLSFLLRLTDMKWPSATTSWQQTLPTTKWIASSHKPASSPDGGGWRRRAFERVCQEAEVKYSTAQHADGSANLCWERAATSEAGESFSIGRLLCCHGDAAGWLTMGIFFTHRCMKCLILRWSLLLNKTLKTGRI